MLRCVARLAAALVLSAGSLAHAQSFPQRPIRLVVGYTPGGGVDINARMLAPRLAALLGQPVIVENRPGAGTNIANEFVARSAPDGHTLLINSPAVAINMSLYRNLAYDTLRDLAPVSIFSESPNILVVRANLPAANMRELVALARAKPGTLNYSSAGAGSTQHLSAELFRMKTGTQITHVPYKGTSPSIAGLIAGEVDLTFANVPAILQYVRAGRIRPLAMTGQKRAQLMPDVPTLAEAGFGGLVVTTWYGVLAPSGTPKPVIRTLADAIAKIAASEELRERLLEQGAEPVGNSPEEFDRLLREEVARWRELVESRKLTAD